MSNIRGILENEKYIGDALLQKTITTDFINKVRIKNDGTEPQCYVKDNHEPIIPKDIFIQVQEELLRRANMFSGEGKKKKRVYSSKYALSSLCVCSKCGDIYRRIIWNNRSERSVVWRCCARVEHGPKACVTSTIREEELQDAVVRAMSLVFKTSEKVHKKLIANIEEVIVGNNINKIEDINKEIALKQKELLIQVREKKDYTDIANEVDELKSEKHKMLVKKALDEDLKSRNK